MKAKLFIILALVALAGCSSGSVTDITPDQLNSMLESEDVYLIDVHIPEQEHIPGTDVMIPYDEITENPEQIPKDQKVVVYCRSDSMSTQASEQLADAGYDVYNLIGGANAWKAEGYETERR